MRGCILVLRLRTVPLICGRWHRLMADASMWSLVDVDLGTRWPRQNYNRSGHSPRNGRLLSWLQQCGPGVHELTLQASGVVHDQIRLAVLM